MSLSFSTQRYATMSLLFPCSIPAWLAPVWLDKSVSHLLTLWLPLSSHPLSVGI
ncbi:MAG: hypothetical protein SPF27_06290 [Methanobrevibacter boviskoreani]|nr:hypothetical protein [Methanobrevibacter boviskoreani]MDY5614891.1 hypothetical protein [Methanobrevibacter boviskoreani]